MSHLEKVNIIEICFEVGILKKENIKRVFFSSFFFSSLTATIFYHHIFNHFI